MTTHEAAGASVTETGVLFRVWAPFASAVFVMGDFNNWDRFSVPLTKDDTGHWHTEIAGAKAGQEYKFVIQNGEQTLIRNDPRALQMTAGCDNSIVVADRFDWEGDDFTLGPLNEQIIYELHLGTFHRHDAASNGTFSTATEKLDYLAELGVTVIELMPVSACRKDLWWGYDPSYLFAVDPAYGSRYDFMRFVKEAHARGIGVILDVVYNHLDPEPGLDLWQFDGWNENARGGIYFYNDWRGDTPWGPRLDFGRSEVREYIADNVRMWMSDFHLDGLRVDSTRFIRNALGNDNDATNDLAGGWQLLQQITETARSCKPQVLLAAEDTSSNEYISKPIGSGGAGFDAQWESSLAYRLHDILEALDDSNRSLLEIEGFIRKNYNNDPFQKVIYSESHDNDANGRARLNEEIAPGHADGIFARRRSALAAALVLTIPGIPMLFQGQEFMEDGYFSHWRELDWDKTNAFHGLLQLYKDLIELRRNQSGTSAGLMGSSFTTLHLDENSKVLAYHRWNLGGPGDDVVVVLNFSNNAYTNYNIQFPRPGIWKTRFNSDWNGYCADYGNTPTPDVVVDSASGAISIAAYGAIILSQVE